VLNGQSALRRQKNEIYRRQGVARLVDRLPLLGISDNVQLKKVPEERLPRFQDGHLDSRGQCRGFWVEKYRSAVRSKNFT
jgi:hypothetical protein